MEGKVVALRPLQYGPKFPEDMVDFHQVFMLNNQQNDEALLRLRYVGKLEKGTRLCDCGKCGKQFTDEFALNRHGQLRHQPRQEPVIKDDHLGKIDTNDPDALEARARQLRRELQHTHLADGMEAPNPEAEAAKAAAEEERFLDEASPIAWDKTKAATKADDVKVPEVGTKAPKQRRELRKRSAPKQAGSKRRA